MNSSKIIRILLVDDHKSFSDGLAMLIGTRKSAMEVAGTASSRVEALALAARAKPDVILLDIDLGNDNGLDLLPEITAASGARVIILTGSMNAETHQTAILRGAQGVLLKTDSAQVILKAIEKVHGGEIWISNEILNRVLGQLNHTKNAGNDRSAAPELRKIGDLTAREREIIRALVNDESSTNKEIADRLFISESTLKNHLTTIYSKLEVKNRIELLKFALAHKLDQS